VQSSRDKHEWNDPCSAAVCIRHSVVAVNCVRRVLYIRSSRKRVKIPVLFPVHEVHWKGVTPAVAGFGMKTF